VDQLGTRRLLLCAVADPTKARPRPERRLLMGLWPHRHRRSMMEEEHAVSNENADLIRRAYEVTQRRLAAMLQYVDPDLEWTYLDPALEHPTPQVSTATSWSRCCGTGPSTACGPSSRRSPAPASWSWSACGRQGSTPISAEVGMTALTACSPFARDGSLPCATVATGKRPSSSPASRHDQRPLAGLRRPLRP
jgi:hypothetical protein